MAAQSKRVRLGVLVGVTTLVAVGGVWVAAATPFEATEPAAAAAAPGEPLAPLSAAEIDTAVRVIEAYHAFPEGAFFPTVTPGRRDSLSGVRRSRMSTTATRTSSSRRSST